MKIMCFMLILLSIVLLLALVYLKDVSVANSFVAVLGTLAGVCLTNYYRTDAEGRKARLYILQDKCAKITSLLKEIASEVVISQDTGTVRSEEEVAAENLDINRENYHVLVDFIRSNLHYCVDSARFAEVYKQYQIIEEEETQTKDFKLSRFVQDAKKIFEDELFQAKKQINQMIKA